MVDDRKFVFTVDQIKEIFDAGIRQGENGYSQSHRYDDCAGVVCDIVNDSVHWSFGEHDDSYVDYDTVKEWFA